MSALVWAVESVILGLWALVLTSFTSNPFHTFLATSHLIISGFTLITQLYNSARVLTIGHGISESFICAVSSLFLVYLMVILDSKNYTNPKLFSMQVFGGFLPIDACIGIAWFCAAIISAIGMALSERGRVCTLMFHHFGYHMLIVPPSFLIFWLYNYDGTTAEPVSQGISYLYHGVRITHYIYTFVLIGIWGVFVVLQATGELLQFDSEWPDFVRMSANGGLRYVLSVFLKLAGRAACVLIPVSAAFSARTGAQAILAWTLAGIGVANSFDWVDFLDRILQGRRVQQQPSSFETPRPSFDPAALSLPRRPQRMDDDKEV